jgi:hypothetical protein
VLEILNGAPQTIPGARTDGRRNLKKSSILKRGKNRLNKATSLLEDSLSSGAMSCVDTYLDYWQGRKEIVN